MRLFIALGIFKCAETDKRGPMPFGFWCAGRWRRLEFRETRSLRDDDRAFQGPSGPVGCSRRNYGVELVARMDCLGPRSTTWSFEPQGATAFESPTTGGGPTNSPNVRHTKSDLAPLRRGTGSHVELWSDTGCKECRKDRKRARKCWPQQDRM